MRRHRTTQRSPAGLEAARLEAEREFWASVKDSQNPAEELQAYLDTYPEGAYAVLARSRLDRLAGLPADAETAPQSTAAVATAARDDPSTPQASVPTAEAVEASLGLERAERRQIQLGLASLGYDPGPADGLFGLRHAGSDRPLASLASAARPRATWMRRPPRRFWRRERKRLASRRRKRRRGSGRRCGRAGCFGTARSAPSWWWYRRVPSRWARRHRRRAGMTTRARSIV